MKHLIVYSHINPDSFSKAILDTLIETSEKEGVEVKIRDLNAINFNPILSSADINALEKNDTPDDIAKEQSFIKWADVITFVYPLWWGHMPAVLKGYIDRVFSYGFAYSFSETDGATGLLPGKKIMLFTPMGNPVEIYEEMGMMDALNLTTDTCIFRYCGMTEIEHLHFGAVPLVDDDERKQMLNKVAALAENFLVKEVN